MKLAEIARRLDCTLEGDGEVDIRGVAGIEDAGPADLTFFVNPKYADALRATRGAAVIAGTWSRDAFASLKKSPIRVIVQ